MREHDLTLLRRELEGLSASQLREIVNKEIEKDIPDDDVVLLSLDILKVRDADKPLVLTDGQKKIWDKHERKLLNRGKSRFRLLPGGMLRVAAMAAVFSALLWVMPQAATAGSRWKIIANWTPDIFRYENIGSKTEETVEACFRTDNPGLQEVYDALGELGIEPRPVPSWLPEGYVLEWIKEIETDAQVGINVYFSNGEKEAVFAYRDMKKDLSPDFDKTKEEAIEYEYGGTAYNLIQNAETWTVNWTTQNLKCSIFIDCQEDVVKQIIRSIY